MNHKVHNQIVNFIWGIADDVLRDVFVRGKYRDIILPFTVLRRIDVLLEPTKAQVLAANQFLVENTIDDKSGLAKHAGYPFYNTSPFTIALNGPKDSPWPFVSLLSDPDKIDSNLEAYLDGFSPNVQEIISKFKIRNQLETMRDAGITYALIEKFASNAINLSPNQVTNTKGETLPPLTNLGMGYVFEELIRRFNEENNEEAGEHFTPRDIIRLMTHIIFEPVAAELRRRPLARYSIYDPACGSGGMLTEAEQFATTITEGQCKFSLFGQEVNPETWAICTGDMLIKGETGYKIAFGSTLSKDDFFGEQFDFMLSNPPYGKSWKIDQDSIVGKGKEIADPRFKKGVPRSSDGQLLFLANMAHKMKRRAKSELGSRVASVHNGSALFTGDAGSGESEIRRWFIENDWLECIIGLPQNMFYNTGIATYIFVLTNNKAPHRKGKIQLIDASEMYQKRRKSLGNKSNDLSEAQIEQITQLYLDFAETPHSKIFDNADFGYHKITVERPLRLRASFTAEAVAGLRFADSLAAEMGWMFKRLGEAVYTNLKPHAELVTAHFEKQGSPLTPATKKKLLDVTFWQGQRAVLEAAQQLADHFGGAETDDYNRFTADVDKAIKKLGLSLTAAAKKQILAAVSVKDESAVPVRAMENGQLIIDNGQLTIMKASKAKYSANDTTTVKIKDGKIISPPPETLSNYQLSIINSQLYLPDSELRDTENVPLKEDITAYFEREVLPHVPDAWIDPGKTTVGYEISFTRYFYQYQPLRSLAEITADLMDVERASEGLLQEIIQFHAEPT